MIRSPIAQSLVLPWLITLSATMALAADPPQGVGAGQWPSIEQQVTEQVDAGIAAGAAEHAVVAGGVDGHGLVRTAVVHGSYGSLPGPHAADGTEFGYSLAFDGDWLAVGAPGTVFNNGPGLDGQGVVFLYRRAGAVWQLELLIRPPMDAPAPRCGHSVALRLPYLAVGCPQGEYGVLVYRQLPSGTWSTMAGISNSTSAECGTALALSGVHEGSGTAKLAIGCPGALNDRGEVRIHQLVDGQIASDGVVAAADSASGDRFGSSVALYRTTAGPVIVQRLAVGAPSKAFAPAFASGKAYLFGGPGWTETNGFTHPSPQSFSATFFGAALALGNTQLIVGVPGGLTVNCANAPRCGQVQRYERSGADWQLADGGGAVNAGGNPPGEQVGMGFGSAVALGFDNLVAVAAPRAHGWTQSNGLAEQVGMVELRRDDSGGWGVSWDDHQGEARPAQIGALAHSQGLFGTALAFGGRRLAIGYPRAGTLLGGRRGQVWVYEEDRLFADGFED